MSEERTEYKTITFERLCEISPELKIIQQDAKRMLKNGNPHKWENYESLKRRMSSCVGFFAHHGLPDFMRTTEAYDVAHHTIFEMLI